MFSEDNTSEDNTSEDNTSEAIYTPWRDQAC